MVGHTHYDIDQVFSTIAMPLAQPHTMYPDQKSLFAQIRNAFENQLDKPDIQEIFPNNIFDYHLLYKPVLDLKLAYYQEPHQFRIIIKLFNVNTPEEIALLHYKNWARSTKWLPCATSHPLISSHPP